MNEALRQSIAEIVAVDYEAQEADYVTEGSPDGHIFEHLKQVSDWLISQNV